jgi:hypothetical protein
MTESGWGRRLDELLEESLTRTGGRRPAVDWDAQVEFSRRHPDLVNIVGLFRTDVTGPDSLIAFCSAVHHGDYAHYDAAGTSRTDSLKIAMAYPLLWANIRWAKRHGAHWFDLGGVTAGRYGDSGDALGGISDFKRFFSKELVDLGGEWMMEPRPLRGWIARKISAAAARVGVTRAET